MADERIKHDEYMVGSGHPTQADTLNRLTLVEHDTDGTHKAATLTSLGSTAIGDLITRTGADAAGVIAAVAAGSYLKSTGTGTVPAWGKLALSDTGVKIGSFNITSADDVTISDVGFSPSVVLFMGKHSGSAEMSFGFDDGTAHYAMSESATNPNYSIYASLDGGNYIHAYISSKNSNGFVIHPVYAGSGSVACYYLALP